MMATLLQVVSSCHDEDDDYNQSDCQTLLHQLDTSLDDEDISNWLNVDANDPGYQLLTEEEII